MKYIKLFENFDELDGFKEYEIIPGDNRFKYDRKEDLSEDLEIIRKFLVHNGSTDISTAIKYGALQKISFYNNNIFHTIEKYKDDWFMIMVRQSERNKFYECDQLDGLLNCIKYLISKK